MTEAGLNAAIAALPAAGGKIFVREGTISLTAAIVLPAKPVSIFGAGPNQTIFDLGANAIAAFEMDADHSYVFNGFTIYGDGVSAQVGFDFGPNVLGSYGASLENVNTGDFAIPGNEVMKVFQGDAAAFVYIEAYGCTFIMADSASAFLLDGGGGAGELHLVTVFVNVAGAPDSSGGFTGATGYVLDAMDCLLPVGNGGTLADIIHLWGCTILGGPITPSPFYGDDRVEIVGCDFALTAVRYLDLPSGMDSCSITACKFQSWTSEAIRIASIRNRLVGNYNCKVTEIGSANQNIYDDNDGFDASTLLADSDTIVNGFKRKNITGQATVDALTAIFTHENDKGLAGAGSIKNTGANSLTIRRTVTDGYGVTDFQEDTVLSGATLTWPMDTAIGTALPSYVSFMVSVRSTTAGLPTTFDLRHSSTGAY